MKLLLNICLILITSAMLWTSWTMHYAQVRIIEAHEANVKSYSLLIVKTLDERNLAEAHVAYLQKEIARWHKNNFKEGKSGDPKSKQYQK